MVFIKLIRVVTLLIVGIALIGARPIAPILTLKSDKVLENYSIEFLLYNKLNNQLLLGYKGKKVANCYFNVEHIEYSETSHVFKFRLELKKKQCEYIFPFHKDKIVPYDDGILRIKMGGQKGQYRFTYIAIEGTPAIKGNVEFFNNKAIKKERDLFFK